MISNVCYVSTYYMFLLNLLIEVKHLKILYGQFQQLQLKLTLNLEY